MSVDVIVLTVIGTSKVDLTTRDFCWGKPGKVGLNLMTCGTMVSEPEIT